MLYQRTTSLNRPHCSTPSIEPQREQKACKRLPFTPHCALSRQQKRIRHPHVRVKRPAQSLPPDAQALKMSQPCHHPLRHTAYDGTAARTAHFAPASLDCSCSSAARSVPCPAPQTPPPARRCHSPYFSPPAAEAAASAGSRELLRQGGLMGSGPATLHPNRQSSRVHRNQNLHALADLRPRNPLCSTARRTVRRVQQALLQPVLFLLLYQFTGLSQDPFEHSAPNHTPEQTPHGAFRTKLPWQIVPFRSVAEPPQDPA